MFIQPTSTSINQPISGDLGCFMALALPQTFQAFKRPGRVSHLPRDAKGVDEYHIALSQNVQMGRQRSHAINLATRSLWLASPLLGDGIITINIYIYIYYYYYCYYYIYNGWYSQYIPIVMV